MLCVPATDGQHDFQLRLAIEGGEIRIWMAGNHLGLEANERFITPTDSTAFVDRGSYIVRDGRRQCVCAA